MKPLGAIFDLDGTLLDSMGMWARIDQRFLGMRGIPVPEDYQLAISAMRMPDAAVYTIARFRLPDTPEALMQEWLDMARDEYAHRIPLKPHARELLTALHARGIRLGTASSLDPELARAALTANGVHHLFHAFTSAAEVGRGKGHPDIYLLAAERLGVPPQRCVMYDDLPEALRGAKAAGLTAVGVHDDCAAAHRAEMLAIADRFIDDLSGEAAYYD